MKTIDHHRHQRDRTDFAFPTLLGLILLTMAAGPIENADPPRPNVVVFMVDDLGWQDVSLPLGPETTDFNRRYRTPNLERLASRGVVFTDAYAASPVCTPTRTSLMTGRHPGRSGITYWTLHADRDNSTKHPRLKSPPWRLEGLSSDDTTLPGLLQESGYRTIHIGKAHFGAIGTSGADPTNLGFETNIAGHAAGGPGSFYGIHDFGANKRQGKTGPSVWDVPGLDEYHGQDVFLTDVLAEEAEKEIRKKTADGRPFFLHFAPYAVHAPIMANPRHLEHYEGIDRREAAYATMIESADAALGRILDTLDELKLTDDTIVIFASDNGGLSAHARGGQPHVHNAPLRSGKGSAYEGGVRVPMVISGPGRNEIHADGRRISTPVTVIDLFPTVLELTNTPLPAEHAPTVDAESLVGLLRAGGDTEVPSKDRGLAWHMPHQWGASGPGIEPFTSFRRGKWKILYFHDGPRIELYDLANDLGETKNLAEEHPDIVQDLLLALEAWYVDTGATISIDSRTNQPVRRPAAHAAILRANAIED
jgi:arylsulfatase A-like enzyme